jgi:hypothetical protein
LFTEDGKRSLQIHLVAVMPGFGEIPAAVQMAMDTMVEDLTAAAGTD